MKAKERIFIEKIVNFLLNILIFIFGVILLASIYTNFQTRVLNNDYTNFFGYSIFEVQTGSMEPVISPGDWIVVKLTDDIKLNDIITYKLNNDFITHRVVEVYSDGYVTKGDANNAKDDSINSKQIIGVVSTILPNFGTLRRSLFNPLVLLALILTLFLFSAAFTKKNKNDKFMIFLEKIKEYIKKYISKIKMLLKKEANISAEKKEPILTKEQEEALEKTSMYRFVSVDNEEENEILNNIDEEKEEELEKTSMYRFVSVDDEEIDNTLLEVAKTEIKNSDKKEEIEEQEEVVVDPEPEKQEESLTNIDLTLLSSTKGDKKGKNPIDTAMKIKKEEIKKIFEFILKFIKTKKMATIRDKYIEKYIEVKYYNIIDIGNKSDNISSIKKTLKNVSDELLKLEKSKDLKYKDMIENYYNIMISIVGIDNASISISDIKSKREFYEDILNKLYKEKNKDEINTIVRTILEIQDKYKNTLEYFLDKLKTDLFDLNYNVLVSNKNMYALDLKYNIYFNKIYSDYIIDKTYTEGVVAEDKIGILLTLLSTRLIENMIHGKFDNKYLLYVPESLYSKNRKLGSILKNIDDEYAKKSIFILIKYKELVNNKKQLEEVRKAGYKFAVVIESDDKLDNKSKEFIYLTNLIFINKKEVKLKNIEPFIPYELKERVINEDLKEKVGGLGGEQQ